MDTTQLLVTIVLSITTILLIVVGIQLIFILRDFRRTIVRVNRIIDGFEALGTGLDHGLTEIVGFVNGFKTIMKAVELIHHKKHDKTQRS